MLSGVGTQPGRLVEDGEGHRDDEEPDRDREAAGRAGSGGC